MSTEFYFNIRFMWQL